MADKPDKVDKKDEVDKEFRRAAAIAMAGAYIAKHGGFEPAAMEVHVRKIWEYADNFVRLENAPPLPVVSEKTAEEDRPKGRAAHPSDEWCVIDGDKKKGGFVSREEADFYASARPGAKVKQVSGPEIHGTK